MEPNSASNLADFFSPAKVSQSSKDASLSKGRNGNSISGGIQTGRKGSRYKGKQIAVPRPELLAKNTLDATHKSRVKFFKDQRKSLASKRKEVQKLLNELAIVNATPAKDRDFHKIVTLEERLRELKKEIEYIESGQGELEYYTKTGELLMEYYEHINSMKKKGRKGGKKKLGKAGAGRSVYDMFMKPQASASLQNHLASVDENGENDDNDHNGGEVTALGKVPGAAGPGPGPGPAGSESEESGLTLLDSLASLGFSTFVSPGPAGPEALDPAAPAGPAVAGSGPLPTPGPEPGPAAAGPCPEAVARVPQSALTSIIGTDKGPAGPGGPEGPEGTKPKETGQGTGGALTFNGTLTGFVQKQEVFNRADYFDEYLSIIDPHFVRDEGEDEEHDEDSYCDRCKCYRYMNHSEAMMICPECGSYEAIVIDSDKPNYKDPPAEISNFPYRRINHFNECLSQFQAKESTEIPQIVYDTILMEMKKERITNMAELTREKVHKYLKKQPNKKFTNYYEHIPHIINRLTGLKPKTMTPKQEEELRAMFHAIQDPYERHKPKRRKNFLNYNYVLHKFCQLRGYDEFLDCFPLLKSKEKLYQQDLVWKKICQELGWIYIPSI